MLGSASSNLRATALNPPDPILDCLVVGAGPAGLTAAIYLRRFHREICVVDAGDSRAKRIPESNNYPGFPEGINGEALLARLRRQLVHMRGDVQPGTVTMLGRADGLFVAQADARTLRARTILLATGVKDRAPRLPGMAALGRKGLLRQCPICDAFEFTGSRIGVIGDDAHCMREALFLRHYSPHISILCIDGNTELDPGQRSKLRANDIPCVVSHASEVREAEGGGVIVRMSDGTEHRFDVLYAAMGSTPNSKLAADLGATLDKRGNVIVDAHCRTSVPGLYAAGDVVSGLDQIAVATGHAAIASTAIHNRLREGRERR